MTYDVSVVTMYGCDSNEPIYSIVSYGFTNEHWYMDPDEIIWPELPSASVLIIACDYNQL